MKHHKCRLCGRLVSNRHFATNASGKRIPLAAPKFNIKDRVVHSACYDKMREFATVLGLKWTYVKK